MHELPCFWPKDWVSNPLNIALKDDVGNISLFDFQRYSVYEGHMYFTSRGREAMEAAREMLRWLFNETFAKTIIGKTPILKKNAYWLVRQLGFERKGLISSEFCPLIVTELTKERFLELDKSH